MTSKKSLLAALSITALLALSACADKNHPDEVYVPLYSLPVAAQKTIVAETGDKTIDRIEKETMDGKVVYEVKTVAANGVKSCLKVDEAGNVVSKSKKTEINVAWKKVPKAVRATMTKNAEGLKIDHVEKETMDGKSIYKAKLMKADGSKLIIKVSPSGKLLSAHTKEKKKDDKAVK